MDEKEALLLRFIGKNGEPVAMLLDLAELDFKDSVRVDSDGSSPDAHWQCIFKCHCDCYERALDEFQLNKDKRLRVGQHERRHLEEGHRVVYTYVFLAAAGRR